MTERTLIIGNSGSGKSTLAGQIATRGGQLVVGLDEIYWKDQRLLRKRSQADALLLARTMAAKPSWVIEGVFGWLIDAVIPRTTSLIWLDLPWEDCRAGLMERGPYDPANCDEFQGLLAWAELYYSRQTSSSHAGHARIFEAFTENKTIISSRADLNLVSFDAIG
jgi:adenylate kinase family enzyme